MTKQQEKKNEVIPTGHYNLQCLECRFKQTIVCGPTEDMSDVNKKSEKICKTHFNNLKHKKMLVVISTYDVVEFNDCLIDDDNNKILSSPPLPITTTKEGRKITGSYTLQCFDCDFNETVWRSDNDNSVEVLDAHDSHRKRFNHKKSLLIATTYWIANYDKTTNDNLITEPAPEGKYRNYDTFQ